MKNKKTHYLLVLDRSGSMADCVAETISGFNEQIQMIRDLQTRYPEQKFYVSLTTFNHTVEHPFVECPVDMVNELTSQNYFPNGTTALLDAIGESVLSLKAKIGKEIENDEATAVVVILTDGHENASRLFRYEAIRKLIKELESEAGWTFSFMGATADAFDTANMKEVMHGISHSMSDYAQSKSEGTKSRTFLKK
jgi:uncharacterized protein YegL